MRRLVLSLSLLTWAGCQCQGTSLDGTRFSCVDDGDCAGGFVCSEGICAAPGTDGGDSGTDGGSGTDAGALVDAGPTTDAGVSDGGTQDAGAIDGGAGDAGRVDSGDPRLIAYWTFDETSGQVLNDSSGNGYAGVLGTSAAVESSDPVRVAGRINNALGFNGFNSVATFPPVPADGGLSVFTYVAWINAQGGGGLGFGRIISRESDAGFDDTYFYYDADDTIGARVGTTTDTTADSGLVPLNIWYQVALTYDDATDRTPHLYLNGVEAPYAVQVAITGVLPLLPRKFSVGNRPALERGFQGIIDDVRIYSVSLSAAEITALYRSAP